MRISYRHHVPLTLVALAVVFLPVHVAQGEPQFKSIFNGKDLAGWDGNPAYWRVKDGAITGQSTKDKPLDGNTFIIWRGGTTGDFELKLEYRIVGGNSGIQYRSFEVDDQKWVVGGYQGDIEAGDTWSGANYGERFRGILAARGQKTVIGKDHKPRVVGSLGDSSRLQSVIKKEDWNECHIIAQDYHFVHKINGQLMSEVTDKDKEMRRDQGILALQLHAGPPMKVQFRNIRLKQQEVSKDQAATSDDKKRIVLIAGDPSHGYAAHEFFAGCTLLAKQLQQTMGYQCEVVRNGYPQDPKILDGANAIVVYCDGGKRHPLNPRLEEFDRLMRQGTGLVCLHYAVEVTKGDVGDKFLEWLGGHFEQYWSVNPHWEADFTSLADHPICQGVKPFKINDEWYFHMRFRDKMEGVTPILSAHPPKNTMRRPDGPASGNSHVRAALARGEIQHVAWAAQRAGGGRSFGFTGGHVHWNWGDDNFRKIVLNAIVWSARGQVPTQGVSGVTPTRSDLEKNQDFPTSEKTSAVPIKAGSRS